MGNRIKFGTMIDVTLKVTIEKLSEKTRIPQSKLFDEALEDLFKKYNFKYKKSPRD